MFKDRSATIAESIRQTWNDAGQDITAPVIWWAETEVEAAMGLLAKIGKHNLEGAFHVYQLVYRMRHGATVALAAGALDALNRQLHPRLQAMGKLSE